MKSDFKTKLIQHMLNKKNGEKGFTLIELLVVIIIIGILAAIALPSFLNQASKARQSEAKSYVGSMNRSQQAYYLEKQQFAASLTTLAVGIASTTANYSYYTGGAGAALVVSGGLSVNSQAVPSVNGATSSTAAVKGYIGGVSVSTPTGSNEATTLATLCEQNLAPINIATAPSIYGTTSTLAFTTNAAPTCTITNGPASTAIQ